MTTPPNQVAPNQVAPNQVAPNQVALDIGNSAIKASVLATADDDQHPDQTFLISATDQNADQDLAARLLDWAAPLFDQGDVNFWVSSVNRAVSVPLGVTIIERHPTACWNELSRTDVPLSVQVDYPDRVGIDRLLSAHAAAIEFPAGAIVVDSGSAVTIDLVTPARLNAEPDGHPVFHGGAILPGVRMQFAALAGGTENLPAMASASVAPATDLAAMSPAAKPTTASPSVGAFSAPAKETESAIRLGVISSIAGAVERLAGDYAKFAAAVEPDLGGKIAVVISGGDADLISRHLRISHIVKHNLVCRGILDLAGRHCFRSAPPL
ncbi:type III pantothenate kinase [Roseiconus lacunae]|uniref:Type III pantothenate kinase n=1 Tax=Roseiconus lacunae TaxID=2605694 RepID=A0ABT7PFZ7_9BACT|nr:type III pantothenate kinase [Roseiconus lacunae]MDM4015420.1 type III pantothenate kinase [Roseiconus lacunae]